MGFNRGHFFSALAGLIIGVMVVAVLPARADNGDPIYLGEANSAKKVTRISINYGMVIRSFRADVPAVTFKVSSGPPIAVSSNGWVANLNADLLDGMEAAAFAVSGHDHDGDYLAIDGTADDSDLLDGRDSTDFAAAGQRCPAGWPMLGIDASGNPLCSSIVTVDSVGNVGFTPSLVLDSSGFPVISYYDTTNGYLKVAHCTDARCSAATINTVDTAGDVGQYSSLVLDSSGYPVISYFDVTNTALKLAHCVDTDCTAAATINTVDNAEDDGDLGSSLVLDSSGFPVISYYNDTNDDLKVAHCSDATCSTSATINTVDTAGDVGQYSSLVLDSSGYPVIAYYDFNTALKVVHCGDAVCGAGNTIVAVDSNGLAGAMSSLALDASGYPVISYYEAGGDDLRLAHCTDANCSGAVLNTVDNTSGADVGTQTSMVLDASGYPIISYRDKTNSDLKVAFCYDANCSWAKISTVDGAGSAGYNTSLALDGLGNLVIAYYEAAADDLKVAFL